MITIAENYMSYSLETPDVIQKFTRLIGASSFIGIRKPKQRINSKFDYEGNVCKVDSVNPDGTVVTSSLWGPQSGERIVFNSVVEVLHLVNLKRG